MPITFERIEVIDVRFPTSDFLDGSDAMNPDPDYSAAYVTLHTNVANLAGHGFTFTIGRGNDIVVKAIETLGEALLGMDLADVQRDPLGMWRRLAGDSQMRWLGPEKGVVHLATAALTNAVWDLWARAAGKPLWKLLLDLPIETVASAIDYRHISDALTPGEAVALLKDLQATRAEREAELHRYGFPAYTTSAGWLGYDDDKIRRLTQQALDDGWRHIKIKVGRSLKDDLRRCRAIREVLGNKGKLMLDANQVWDVDEAIANMKVLAEFEPWWIEEPTSPDDVLGHARIASAIRPIGVATGEHCHNRIMFKQFMQAGAMQFAQIDACRLGGVNEVLAVMLMARKFDIPICPHAGGVGLCELVQHYSMFDYAGVSGRWDDRLTEHAAHLHEHMVDPIQIRGGRYMPPMAPGMSGEIKAKSLAEYAYPAGHVWQARKTPLGGSA